jgi:hypothetical protein
MSVSRNVNVIVYTNNLTVCLRVRESVFSSSLSTIGLKMGK